MDGTVRAPRFRFFTSGLLMPTPAPEVIMVTKRRVSCDGGGGPLGHPRVFLEMGAAREVECPYCDRKFVLSREAADADDDH